MTKHVWYVGYGSNLDEDRFRCYLEGGTPYFSLKNKGGQKVNRENSESIENRMFEIPHRLYFAWPEGKKFSQHWGKGGTAFLDRHEIDDKRNYSYGRIWKITAKQFEMVRQKEGELYQYPLQLGIKGDIPIFALTNENVLNDILKPSHEYLMTIARGLRDTCRFDAAAFIEYMSNKAGIRGNYDSKELQTIFDRSCI